MGSADHWLEVKLAVSDGSGQLGLCARVDDTAFTGVFGEVADDAYKEIEVTDGEPSTGETGASHTHTTGEVYALEASGTTFTFYLNGSSVFSFSSSHVSTNTKVGLHLNESSSGAVRFDDFRAGVGPYPGPAASQTDASAGESTATGQAFDATAVVIRPAPLLMAPMVAP
jgi:hypothetical protein